MIIVDVCRKKLIFRKEINMDKDNNFIYAAQYYRNPTPDRSQWKMI